MTIKTRAARDAVLNRLLQRGHDRADASYRADQWEKRQDPKRWANCASTHCERRQECTSPNDCFAATAAHKEQSDG